MRACSRMEHARDLYKLTPLIVIYNKHANGTLQVTHNLSAVAATANMIDE